MRWRRRKTIVSFSDQFWFSMELIVNALALFIIISFFLFIPPMNKIMGHAALSENASKSLFTLLALKWPLVLVSIIISAFIGMIQSHRLFGSAYAINKVVESWLGGERDLRVHLRKSDYLKSIETNVNALLDMHDLEKKKTKEKVQLAKKCIADNDTKNLEKIINELEIII